jgi:hypothetical protein
MDTVLFTVSLRDCEWGWSKDFDTLHQAVAFAIKQAARHPDTYEVHRLDWQGKLTRLATIYGAAPDLVLFKPHAEPTC